MKVCTICNFKGIKKEATCWYQDVFNDINFDICNKCLQDFEDDTDNLVSLSEDSKKATCDVDNCENTPKYVIIHFGVLSDSLQREMQYRCGKHAGEQ